MFAAIRRWFRPEKKLAISRIVLVAPWDAGMYAKENVGKPHQSCPGLKCVRCDVVGCQGEKLKVAEHYEEA